MGGWGWVGAGYEGGRVKAEYEYRFAEFYIRVGRRTRNQLSLQEFLERSHILDRDLSGYGKFMDYLLSISSLSSAYHCQVSGKVEENDLAGLG